MFNCNANICVDSSVLKMRRISSLHAGLYTYVHIPTQCVIILLANKKNIILLGIPCEGNRVQIGSQQNSLENSQKETRGRKIKRIRGEIPGSFLEGIQRETRERIHGKKTRANLNEKSKSSL